MGLGGEDKKWGVSEKGREQGSHVLLGPSSGMDAERVGRRTLYWSNQRKRGQNMAGGQKEGEKKLCWLLPRKNYEHQQLPKNKREKEKEGLCTERKIARLK